MNAPFSPETISLSGELDVSRRDEVRGALQLGERGGAILVDLAGATYADSIVIAELLRFRREAEAAGRRLALLIASSRLERILQVAGLTTAFRVFTDRAEALDYLSGTEAP